MHRAPAVNFPVKRSRLQVWLIVCMSQLAVAGLVAFALAQPVLDARTGILALAVFVASSMALLGWRQSPQGDLRWDGQHWYWSGFAENPVCKLRLLMDFQSFVVVNITAKGQAPLSLWLEAIPGDASWKRLRRAIVSSQAESNGKDKNSGLGVQGDPA